jgi:hypothetical protein
MGDADGFHPALGMIACKNKLSAVGREMLFSRDPARETELFHARIDEIEVFLTGRTGKKRVDLLLIHDLFDDLQYESG